MKLKYSTKVIAFYLPQFHPIPENDKWWGTGFTEWTNVGKAIPLFNGHYQPRVPTDLGYYDLRIPEVREAQACLAREAGVEAFCYWHYWFGNGKQLLEKPLTDVIQSGKPDFPFCLAWANHSWERKDWNADTNHLSSEVLIRQEYMGVEDIDKHFYTLLPVFKDNRYYRVKGKLLFVLYLVRDIPDLKLFIDRWNLLSEENSLPGFYFIAQGTSPKDLEDPAYQICDGINLTLRMNAFGKNLFERKAKALISMVLRRPINTVDYRKAVRVYCDPVFKKDRVYPTILPNWDHSPRSGVSATIMHNSRPEYFREHVKNVLDIIKHKPDDDRLVFLKSWNEWAEGNYMEPDIRFGRGYIKALKMALTESEGFGT
ncbi:MAG: lipopolysaccharide biosynthesis protein [Chlorobiaceae bacterium]|nr:lipopolysaccharide biosynthesis protein [Chlorobiaceae bacterium]